MLYPKILYERFMEQDDYHQCHEIFGSSNIYHLHITKMGAVELNFMLLINNNIHYAFFTRPNDVKGANVWGINY
jgi:hypothetical protein